MKKTLDTNIIYDKFLTVEGEKAVSNQKTKKQKKARRETLPGVAGVFTAPPRRAFYVPANRQPQTIA